MLHISLEVFFRTPAYERISRRNISGGGTAPHKHPLRAPMRRLRRPSLPSIPTPCSLIKENPEHNEGHKLFNLTRVACACVSDILLVG